MKISLFVSVLGMLVAMQSQAATNTADVIVIGAGMSGLSAAQELQRLGVGQVIVLEARNRVGGRIHSHKTTGGKVVDLGASWIHGVRKNPVARLAKRHAIATLATDYENVQVMNVDDEDLLYRLGEKFENFVYKFDQQTIGSLYQQFVDKFQLDNRLQRYLRYYINAYFEHESGADINDLSAESFEIGEEFGGGDVVFPGGYGQLIDVLADGVDIRLNQVVSEVDYSGEGVTVTTTDGQEFFAKDVISTLPLGVLKAGTVAFIPELPGAKQQAIEVLQMGVLDKVYIQFAEAFWADQAPEELLGYVSEDGLQWSETLNLRAYTREPALLMFNSSQYAKALEQQSDSQVKAAALAALSEMFGPVPEPEQVIVTRWYQDPFSHGSYSYLPAGESDKQYSKLAKPIEGKLYFAGEASSSDYPATVHGAYLSGVRAAKQLVAEQR